MSRPILPESAYEALGLTGDAIKNLMSPKPTPEPPRIVAPNILHSNEDSSRPMAPNETSIILYAELLLHIRTVTLFASLRTNHSQETKARLSADGSYITVSHEGETASIRLPINVKGGGDAALSLPSQPPSKELTLRLQMEEREGSDLLGRLQGEDRKANIVPWSGATLEQCAVDIEISCKDCKSVLVQRGKIAQWRDLPNENWAEMMDFWHCHKPDEHHLHDHTHEETFGRKGYAAGNRLEAVQGIGFVDLTSFLLRPDDCDGVQVAQGQGDKPLCCKQCMAAVGVQETAHDGWRINKWSVGVSNSSRSPTTFSISKWISARLLYLADNTGMRKFHIHPTPSSSSSSSSSPVPSLLIWLFTPDLLFSSSLPSPLFSSQSAPRNDPTRSTKIFYTPQTWKPPAPGEPESANTEDIEFPSALFESLKLVLQTSQALLPATARKFQGWEVGLLERFDIEEGQMGTSKNEEEKEHDAKDETEAETEETKH